MTIFEPLNPRERLLMGPGPSTVPQRILRAMGALLRDNRPLAMFGWMAAGSMAAALALGVPVVVEFARTGLVERLPTAVLATGLTVIALVLTTLGLLLESVARARVEAKRLAYLQNRP